MHATTRTTLVASEDAERAVPSVGPSMRSTEYALALLCVLAAMALQAIR